MADRGARRACIRNPDRVYVEIIESDPMPELDPAPGTSSAPVGDPLGDGKDTQLLDSAALRSR